MEKDYFELATIIMGGICTFAIFSFLIKENVFYRFFEHIFIGISAALGILLTIKNFLWPKVFYPLLGLDIVKYPDGTMSKEYDLNLLWLLLPMSLGLLYYFIYSKKHSWLAKLVIGLSLGASGGLAFKGFFNQAVPQIISSFKPIVVITNASIDYLKSLENIVFLITLLFKVLYCLIAIFGITKILNKKGITMQGSENGRFILFINKKYQGEIPLVSMK